MSDILPNGEPKKIFLSKPFKNPVVPADQPTTSAVQHNKNFKNFYGEKVYIPPRRHMPPVDKNDERINNRRKQRYWNSWEELYLVELWRRFKDEIILTNVTLPAYRKIMVAMRSRNMIVTAQDCRRKINNLYTRYKHELSRMESSNYKTEWRLFPLIHCVIEPKIKEYDPWQEFAIIKKLLDKIPKPVEAPPPTPAQVPTTALGPTPQTGQKINNNVNNTKPHQVLTHSNLSSNQKSLLASIPPSTQNKIDGTPYNRLSAPRTYLSIMPFYDITIVQLEQVRHDNKLLAQQRDADLKSLHIEEKNLKSFEEFIRTWTEQKEIELRSIQLMNIENSISINNQENQKC